MQSVCVPKNRQLQFPCCVHNPFALLPNKHTDLHLVYNDVNTELHMQRSYQESEHFCVHFSFQDTATKVLQDCSIPIRPSLGKKSDQQSQEQRKGVWGEKEENAFLIRKGKKSESHLSPGDRKAGSPHKPISPDLLCSSHLTGI